MTLFRFPFTAKAFYPKALLLICLFGVVRLHGQREYTYSLRSNEENPLWIERMYSPNADPGEVLRLYIEYYRTHPFVKNEHTQYYKRWIPGLGKKDKPQPF